MGQLRVTSRVGGRLFGALALAALAMASANTGRMKGPAFGVLGSGVLPGSDPIPHNDLARLEPAFVRRELGSSLAVPASDDGRGAREPLSVHVVSLGANDLFANAMHIVDDRAVRESAPAGGATLEPTEAVPSCAHPDGSLWYVIALPAAHGVALDTVGSDVENTLVLYTVPPGGGFAELHEEACSRSTGANPAHALFLDRRPRTLYIEVARGPDSEGLLSLNVDPLPLAGTNDNESAAQVVGEERTTGNPMIATTDRDEVTSCVFVDGQRAFTNTLWYRFHADSDRPVMVETAPADVARWSPAMLAVAVYEGGAANPSSCAAGEFARILLHPAEGVSYRVQVGIVSTSTPAPFDISLAAIGRPTNDDVASPIDIDTASLPMRKTTVTTLAGETGEPQPCAPMGRTVWYRLRPTRDMTVAVDTFDERTQVLGRASRDIGFVDTVIAAYSVRESQLDLLECSDDGPGSSRGNHAGDSQIAFQMRHDETYLVQIGGRVRSEPQGTAVPTADGGDISVLFRHAAPPKNDSIQSPVRLAAVSSRDATSSLDATTSPDEPASACAPMGATLWYEFTARDDEQLVFAARSRNLNDRLLFAEWNPRVDKVAAPFSVGFPAAVAVFQRVRSSWTPIACDDDRDNVGRAVAAVGVRRGQTYVIEVGGLHDTNDYRDQTAMPLEWGPDRGSVCIAVLASAEANADPCPPVL